MSGVADKLSKFLERAFTKAFSRENLKDDMDLIPDDNSSFLYDNIQEYKDAGLHFRRTKNQMSRGLTREEAFEELRKSKKKL